MSGSKSKSKSKSESDCKHPEYAATGPNVPGKLLLCKDCGEPFPGPFKLRSTTKPPTKPATKPAYLLESGSDSDSESDSGRPQYNDGTYLLNGKRVSMGKLPTELEETPEEAPEEAPEETTAAAGAGGAGGAGDEDLVLPLSVVEEAINRAYNAPSSPTAGAGDEEYHHPL